MLGFCPQGFLFRQVFGGEQFTGKWILCYHFLVLAG
jgi:hypothetical protein